MEKERYEFVDLMKGICIILVVSMHIGVPCEHPLFLSLFRMPLFFAVSGFFFSKYDSFITFFKKKTNTLLIPYLFFSIPNLLVISIFYLRNRQAGILWAYENARPLFNGPIWFLLSLYFAGLLFYLISEINDEKIKLLTIVVISFIGYQLTKYHITLPMYMNSSLNVLVFYYWGYCMRRIGILSDNRFIRTKLLLLIIFFAIIVSTVSPIPELVLENITNMPYYYFVLAGISGISIILYLSKWINKLKMINFIGKYSIIIMATHWILIRLFCRIIPHHIFSHPLCLWGVFVFILVTAYPLIKFFMKYFPKFCAQKPLLK